MASGFAILNRSRAAVLALVASLHLVSPAATPSLAAQEPEEEVRVVRLTGRVLDAESGEGVPGVMIQLFGRPDRHVTGVDGRLAFDVPLGRYALHASKRGYATVESDVPVDKPGRFTLAMHRLEDVDLRVPARLLVRVGEAGSGRPIEGAAVALRGSGERGTDARGMAEFTNLKEPSAEVSVEVLGYAKRTEPVALSLERTTMVQMAMTVEAIGLDPIEVEVRSRFLEARGVYWRIDHGRVQHLLTRENLDTLSVLSDGFKGLLGIRVEHYGGLPHVIGRGGCPLRVFMDGFPLDTNIDDVLPEEVEVVEVFWAERTPVQFGGIDNRCGAVVLWSKRKAGRQ